ncbi:MAG: peptidoglycan endopeptidase [Sphingorhabdus sp.]
MIETARAGIAKRALQAVGTPYRLFGRVAGKSLDCVGLVLTALGPEYPHNLRGLHYSLKGDQIAKARACFAGTRFLETEADGLCHPGDLILVAPGPSQLHFMVCVFGGWVHADAGLGRVVMRPGELPWPIKCSWRLNRN